MATYTSHGHVGPSDHLTWTRGHLLAVPVTPPPRLTPLASQVKETLVPTDCPYEPHQKSTELSKLHQDLRSPPGWSLLTRKISNTAKCHHPRRIVSVALKDITAEFSIPRHVTTAPEKRTDTGTVKNSPSTDNPAVTS